MEEMDTGKIRGNRQFPLVMILDLLLDLFDRIIKLAEKMTGNQVCRARIMSHLSQGQGIRVHGSERRVFRKESGGGAAIVNQKIQFPHLLQQSGIRRGIPRI